MKDNSVTKTEQLLIKNRVDSPLVSVIIPVFKITSRIFRTFFWGSPGQVLLCLKSGHHGRLSRTHGPDVYFCFW